MAKKVTSIDDAVEEFNSKGKNPSNLFRLGSLPSPEPMVSSGIFALDEALGGGFGRSCFVEMYGPPGGGKTALALKLAAEVQKLGETVAFIDLEHAFNRNLADNCGVKTEELLISQPNSGEQALQMVEDLIQSETLKPGLIIIDSVGGLVTQAELNGDFGDALIGAKARLISQGVAKLTALLNETNSSVIILWINQLRDKIGGFGAGPTTTTPGGHALRHAHSVRCNVVRVGQIKKGETVIGHEIKVKTEKNKFYVPFQSASFDVLYFVEGGGFDEASVLKLAKTHKIVTMNGSWYVDAGTGEKIGNGQIAAVEFLIANPDTFADLKSRVKAALHP